MLIHLRICCFYTRVPGAPINRSDPSDPLYSLRVHNFGCRETVWCVHPADWRRKPLTHGEALAVLSPDRPGELFRNVECTLQQIAI